MFKKLFSLFIFIFFTFTICINVFAFNHKLRNDWYNEEITGVKKEDVTSITIEDGGYDTSKLKTYWAIDGYGLIAYLDGESDIVISIPKDDTLETGVDASNIFSFFVYNDEPDYETGDDGIEIRGLNPPDEGYPETTYSKYISKLESINNLYLLNTYCTENFDGMFMGLKELREIDLSSMNTRFAKSMNNMFTGCENLKSIDMSNFDTSSVESMECMFKDCIRLQEVNIKNLKTENLKNMSGMFQNCDSLVSIDLNNLDTGNVRNMSNMFYLCDNLQIVSLDKLDTKELRTTESMFDECVKLKYVDLSKFNTKSINNCRLMFYNCKSLESLDLSSFVLSGNVELNYMLSEVKNLKAIIISKDICDKIDDIQLPGTWINIATKIEYNFKTHNNKKPTKGSYIKKVYTHNENLN